MRNYAVPTTWISVHGSDSSQDGWSDRTAPMFCRLLSGFWKGDLHSDVGGSRLNFVHGGSWDEESGFCKFISNFIGRFGACDLNIILVIWKKCRGEWSAPRSETNYLLLERCFVLHNPYIFLQVNKSDGALLSCKFMDYFFALKLH